MRELRVVAFLRSWPLIFPQGDSFLRDRCTALVSQQGDYCNLLVIATMVLIFADGDDWLQSATISVIV